MSKLLRQILAVISCAAATAASAAPPNTGVLVRPKSVPEAGTSNFDASLRCMDELLARSDYVSGYPVYVVALTNEEVLKATTRDMIVSALSRMSERSRAFRIHTLAESDKIPRDSLVVGGSITALEEGIIQKGQGGGISVGPLSLGRRGRTMDSLLNLTVYFQDGDGVVIPATTQNISVALRTTGRDGDISANFGLLGGSLSMDISQSDGPMSAVRALIDLGLVQAVGNWAGLPYQRCLTLSQTDPQSIQQARKLFDKLTRIEQLGLIAEGLSKRGIYRGSPKPERLTSDLRAAISDFQAQQGLSPLGLPSFEIYYALYASRFGAPVAPKAPVLATGQGRNPLGIRVSPSGSNFFSPPAGGNFIMTKARARFVVSSVREAYVTCFYTDANRQTTRIYPNPQRVTQRLMPGENLMLPGPEDIYTIEPEIDGVDESITCLASSAPVDEGRLGALAQSFAVGTPPLPVRDAAELEARLQQMGLNGNSVYRMTYTTVLCQQKDGDFGNAMKDGECSRQ
jgi:hypothetical protein